MIYTWQITYTAGADATSKTRTVLKLEKGTIVRCEIIFPVGCSNLVFVHINHATHQVYPKNPDYQATGSGTTFVSDDEYSIKEVPYQLEAFGFNTDEVFDHTITINLQIIPKYEVTRLAIAEMVRLQNLKKPI